MQNSLKPTARRDGLVVQELPDEVLVYDLNTYKAHCLNKSAAAVWKNCNGKNTILEIAALLKKEFSVQINEEFVWLAIDQLGKDELLTQKIETPTTGMSRREMMRRVGIVSLVALPVVMSLVAPPAALAATCTGVPNGGTCTGGQCCNGMCQPAGTGGPGATCDNATCNFCQSGLTCCPGAMGNPPTCQMACFTGKKKVSEEAY
jgi:hypothetical protein